MKNKLREKVKVELEKMASYGYACCQEHRCPQAAVVDNYVLKILSLAKECAPEEKDVKTAYFTYEEGFRDGFNAGVKQFLANIEGEKE